ncbi:hypothetical protein ACWC9T_36740 [Kitasatospora sp. NPDC001159]
MARLTTLVETKLCSAGVDIPLDRREEELLDEIDEIHRFWEAKQATRSTSAPSTR